jgi:hypothetical protein
MGVLVMTATDAQTRTRELVRDNDIAIDLIAEGSGPLIVMLPSRGRDSEDYDAVAAGSPGPASACCGRSRAASWEAPGRSRASRCTIWRAISPS